MDGGFDIVEKLLGLTLLGTEWVLWLLIGLSCLSLAIVFERWRFFQTLKLDFTEFSDNVSKYISEKDWVGLKSYCEHSDAPEAKVLLRGLEVKDLGHQAVEDRIQGYLISCRQIMDKWLVVLGTLGNNAPFIGLFGTVLGIIIAFKDLSDNPAGGPSVVMAGISEALVATAVGLIVAIPAVVAYNAFGRVVKRRVANTESIAKLFLTHLEKRSS